MAPTPTPTPAPTSQFTIGDFLLKHFPAIDCQAQDGGPSYNANWDEAPQLAQWEELNRQTVLLLMKPILELPYDPKTNAWDDSRLQEGQTVYSEHGLDYALHIRYQAIIETLRYGLAMLGIPNLPKICESSAVDLTHISTGPLDFYVVDDRFSVDFGTRADGKQLKRFRASAALETKLAHKWDIEKPPKGKARRVDYPQSQIVTNMRGNKNRFSLIISDKWILGFELWESKTGRHDITLRDRPAAVYRPPEDPDISELSEGFGNQSLNKSPDTSYVDTGGDRDEALLKYVRSTWEGTSRQDIPTRLLIAFLVVASTVGRTATVGTEYPPLDAVFVQPDGIPKYWVTGLEVSPFDLKENLNRVLPHGNPDHKDQVALVDGQKFLTLGAVLNEELRLDQSKSKVMYYYAKDGYYLTPDRVIVHRERDNEDWEVGHMEGERWVKGKAQPPPSKGAVRRSDRLRSPATRGSPA